MGSYRLLKKRGNHVEYDGKKPITYKGGDLVPSEHNLAKLFPNKFVPVRPEEDEDVEVEQPDIPVPSPKTTKSKSEKAKSEKPNKPDKKTVIKKTSTQRKRAVPKAKPEGG